MVTATLAAIRFAANARPLGHTSNSASGAFAITARWIWMETMIALSRECEEWNEEWMAINDQAL
jgi:hypothetical protein